MSDKELRRRKRKAKKARRNAAYAARRKAREHEQQMLELLASGRGVIDFPRPPELNLGA